MSEKILLGHGSGGRLMHRLVRETIAPVFEMRELSDSALLEVQCDGTLALTTDSYVVSPLFFPGGNIGDLAVCGTVNDLAVMGARPLYLTSGFILEEGLPLEVFQSVVASMARAARNAGVRIVAGDTKVVDRGKCDGIFINTAGVGCVAPGVRLGADRIHPGDRILVSGPLGTHGIAVMAERNGLSFQPAIESDTAPLNGLVEAMLSVSNSGIRIMRDPTRGGLVTTLKEIAEESGRRFEIRETQLPILPGVRGACELLGLDPLHVANEGVLAAIVSPEDSDNVLAAMKEHPLGKSSALIGEVKAEDDQKVVLRTPLGATRMLDMLTGDQLPRIC